MTSASTERSLAPGADVVECFVEERKERTVGAVRSGGEQRLPAALLQEVWATGIRNPNLNGPEPGAPRSLTMLPDA